MESPYLIGHLSLELTTGTRVGLYEVIAQIGAGAMSDVHRARDTRLDRIVAIKALRPRGRSSRFTTGPTT